MLLKSVIHGLWGFVRLMTILWRLAGSRGPGLLVPKLSFELRPMSQSLASSERTVRAETNLVKCRRHLPMPGWDGTPFGHEDCSDTPLVTC